MGDSVEILVGDYVKKIKGEYAYSGQVMASFKTRRGHRRFVVESTSEGSLGMLFIFNVGQLAVTARGDG